MKLVLQDRTLGKLVQQRRDSLGLSQFLVAVRSSVQPSTVHNVETGIVDPKFSNVMRIVEALGGRLFIEWGDGEKA